MLIADFRLSQIGGQAYVNAERRQRRVAAIDGYSVRRLHLLYDATGSKAGRIVVGSAEFCEHGRDPSVCIGRSAEHLIILGIFNGDVQSRSGDAAGVDHGQRVRPPNEILCRAGNPTLAGIWLHVV